MPGAAISGVSPHTSAIRTSRGEITVARRAVAFEAFLARSGRLGRAERITVFSQGTGCTVGRSSSAHYWGDDGGRSGAAIDGA